MKLICIPYAGAWNKVYFSWRKWFPECKIDEIMYRGNGVRCKEEKYKNCEDALEDCISQIKKLGDEDYILYGHSLGSYIAFFSVLLMEKRNIKTPKKLILAGLCPPDFKEKEEVFLQMPYDVFMSRISEMKLLPDVILQNERLKSLYGKALYHDVYLKEEFVYKEEMGKINMPLYVFTGSEDKKVPFEKMKQWKRYCTGEFHCYEVKGGHFFAFDQENTDFQNEMLKILSV